MSGHNAEKKKKKEVIKDKEVYKYCTRQEVKPKSLPSELRSCLMTSAFINSTRGKTFRPMPNLHTAKLT